MAAIRLRQWLLAAAVAYNYAKVCKYGDLAVPIHYFPHSHRKKLQFIFAWLTGSLSAADLYLARYRTLSVCVCMSLVRTCVLFLKRSVLVVSHNIYIDGVRRTDIYKAQRYVYGMRTD